MRRLDSIAVVLSLACLWLIASQVDLEPVDVDVREAVLRYEELEYDDVLPLLTRALAKRELTARDRQIALAFLGRTEAVFQRPAKAQAAFEALLRLNRDFRIGEYESLLIQQSFEAALRAITAESLHIAAAPTPAPRDEDPEDVASVKVPVASAVPPAPSPARAGMDWDRPELWWSVAAVGVLVAVLTTVVLLDRQPEQPPPRTWSTWRLP